MKALEELPEDNTEPDTPDDDTEQMCHEQGASQFRNDLAARLSCPPAADDHGYNVVI